MIPLDVLFAFIATTCGFMLIPGPAMLYVATVGVERGRNSGMAAASGLAIGSLLLATAAAAGLTAVLAASEALFTVLKLCGVAYLAYLGVRRLMTPMTELIVEGSPAIDRSGTRSEVGAMQEIGRGVLVSISNPKDALFFFAFLPQFTSTANGNTQVQMFVLGCVFAAIALVFDGCYGLLASRLRHLFTRRPRVWRSQRWTSGCAYLLMAALAAFSSNRARAV